MHPGVARRRSDGLDPYSLQNIVSEGRRGRMSEIKSAYDVASDRRVLRMTQTSRVAERRDIRTPSNLLCARAKKGIIEQAPSLRSKSRLLAEAVVECADTLEADLGIAAAGVGIGKVGVEAEYALAFREEPLTNCRGY